jgi:anti-sigma B factor antagonist
MTPGVSAIVVANKDTVRANPVTEPPVRIPVPRQLVVGNRAVFRDRVLGVIGAGHHHFAFDLAACEYVDSAGLGTLLALRKHIREAGGSLVLENPSSDVRELFELTRLDTVFEILPRRPSG